LRGNAETFSKLIDQSPFGIYTVDSEFRIAQVSTGAQPAFRNVQSLIGRGFGEAIRIIWPETFASEVIDIFRHRYRSAEAGFDAHLQAGGPRHPHQACGRVADEGSTSEQRRLTKTVYLSGDRHSRHGADPARAR
jgi:hypothetical protein